MQPKQIIPLITNPPASEESGNELLEKGRKRKHRTTKPESLPSKLADYGLALFFLMFLIMMILVCIFFGPGAPPSSLKLITLDDLFDPTLKAKIPTINWIKGNAYTIFSPTTNDIERHTVPNDITSILADQSKALDKDNKQLNFSSGYSFSYDEQYILIPVNVKTRWRHSFYANYLIWEVSSQTYKTLGPLLDSPVILNAQWSTTNYTIAFVMNNDIYITSVDSPGTFKQITQDASSNIENGIMSWVYEEEVFSDYNAIWWRPAVEGQISPGQFLFMRSNNSLVQTFSYPIYNDVEDNPYTTIMDLKYPKSGSPNPDVSLVLYNVLTNNLYTLPGLVDEYITDVIWLSSNILACRTTNRLQNKETLFIYNVDDTGRVAPPKIFVTQIVENGWIVPRPYKIAFLSPYIVFIRNNTDNYHLHILDITNINANPIPLTKGPWDVTDLVGSNPDEGIVYFMCALQNQIGQPLEKAISNPTESHLCALQIRINLQLDLTPSTGYYSVNFNKDGTYFAQYNEGPGIPKSNIYQAPTVLTNNTLPTLIRPLETNKALEDKLTEYNLPSKTFYQVQIPSGISLNTWYLLPPNISPSEYYPVLFDVYCGPNSQTVTKKWRLGFDEYVASSLNIIVASVDCRGTGARGISFMQQVYNHLGSLEAQDIIEVAKQLGELSWMDSGRIGIWGWSYGGYMTLRTLIEDGGNVFKTGISIAPVTDWRLYDTFYTERFMNTPQLNYNGYNQSSIVIGASGLGKVPFLLAHGTGDDNVHFQNTAVLNDKLVSLGIQYDTMIYANRQHSINSQGSLKHLYKLITNYLINNLSGLSPVRLHPKDN